MKTFAIIVTYGNRFLLLRKVVLELLNIKIDKIVIVDNKSEKESADQLIKLRKEYKSIIEVVSLNENTGSAKGYAIGIRKALEYSDCEFIWLLDDDNKPDENALSVLKEFWRDLKVQNKNERVCLASHRKDRQIYKDAVIKNNPQLVLGRKNIFRAFHIANMPSFLRNRIVKKIKKSNISVYSEKTAGEVYAVPYGGMFFNKDLIDLIGYPDEKLYLYVDDHEYSYRIIKKGGAIWLLLNSTIRDIDQSWHVQAKGFAVNRIAKDTNHIRLYYSIRNRVYFERNELVTNRVVYYLNMIIYSLIVVGIALPNFKFKNIRIYCIALLHGLTGKMGINKNYEL